MMQYITFQLSTWSHDESLCELSNQRATLHPLYQKISIDLLRREAAQAKLSLKKQRV